MICFAWSGFPQYAARCIGAYVKATGGKCVVVATRPRVPVENMEKLCGCPVIWIEATDSGGFMQKLGTVPDILFVDGWAIRPFNLLRDKVTAAGGKVFVMIDNNYIFSAKELIKALRFRMLLRSHYDGYLVPGKSGKRLLDFYGAPHDRIEIGMYSADNALFTSPTPIQDRPKRIIFVGQLCDRKNIVNFAKIFLSVSRNAREGWQLEICGCGPDRDRIPSDPDIIVHDFVQPEDLAAIYQNARVFVLPSKEEHWGLVVHEAALSGCYLLVSKQVGAAEDFVTQANGRVFDAFSAREMQVAIEEVLRMSDADLGKASHASLQLAKHISLDTFVFGVTNLIGAHR